MLDIYPDIDRWLEEKETIGLATVTQTWGSSPRPVGAKMAFTLSGKISGSVSGGCVEGAVYEAGVLSIKSNHPELLHFGVTDETAFSVGLACGGKIDIFVRKLDPRLYRVARSELVARKSAAILSILDGPAELKGREAVITQSNQLIGSLGQNLDQQATKLAFPLMEMNKPQAVTFELAREGNLNLFVDVIAPPPTLVIIGGVHIAITLASLAKSLGYYTVVIDPRRSFGNPERFPHVDQLIQSWPEEALQQVELSSNTCVAVLTHDPKIDDPAIKIALNSPVFYIGALGSRQTHTKRCQRLETDGFTPKQIKRIKAPIGLNLGENTPEETALAVMAEIVATRHGKTVDE